MDTAASTATGTTPSQTTTNGHDGVLYQTEQGN
jgi:hypothetical protein